MPNPDLHSLEAKIERLIHEYKRVNEAHSALLKEQQVWRNERTTLIKQNELARSRVEAMIERLKTMEQSDV